MTDDVDWEAYLAMMAAVMDLTLQPEWRAAVLANLRATATHAERVTSFPLPDDVEAAPVFEA
jgi:hypothetical protein